MERVSRGFETIIGGMSMNTNNGWICPKCGRVHAPYIPECQHCNEALIVTSNFDEKEKIREMLELE